LRSKVEARRGAAALAAAVALRPVAVPSMFLRQAEAGRKERLPELVEECVSRPHQPREVARSSALRPLAATIASVRPRPAALSSECHQRPAALSFAHPRQRAAQMWSFLVQGLMRLHELPPLVAPRVRGSQRLA